MISLFGIIYYGISGIVSSFFVYIILEVFVGNATLHRYYGHRSFEMSLWKVKLLTWLAHHIGVGSVLGWTGHHRWHHKYSDTDKDLHSPTKQGISHILFGIWEFSIPRKMISDIIKDPLLIKWHKYYYHYHTVAILSLLLISPWALVFIYAIPNLGCLLSGYAIAILPHRTGIVKNDLLTEILTLGEGWHKNHHDDATLYRFSKYDFTAFIIEKLLKKKNV
jgi:stearoyl-CoA desaturase (delta-9 desaturase)